MLHAITTPSSNVTSSPCEQLFSHWSSGASSFGAGPPSDEAWRLNGRNGARRLSLQSLRQLSNARFAWEEGALVWMSIAVRDG
jgi:hypothetical protein